jgi:hypothetical protein
MLEGENSPFKSLSRIQFSFAFTLLLPLSCTLAVSRSHTHTHTKQQRQQQQQSGINHFFYDSMKDMMPVFFCLLMREQPFACHVAIIW